MPLPPLPADDDLVIGFAHSAYRLAERFALRNTGIEHFQAWTPEDALARAGGADVLVLSGFWNHAMLDGGRLRFVQSASAGVDQYPLDELTARGIPLASASGVNRNAVSDHALALMLALTRNLHLARDEQHRREWRGMTTDLSKREDELAGKTLLVVGLGAIGERVARLARAFEMHVVGLKRDAARHAGNAHEVHPADTLDARLPEADFVVLACALNAETEGLIDAARLARMKPGAVLVNVSRGKVVDEGAVAAALESGPLAGAALDTFRTEPLGADSPLWGLPNALITSHVGGETRRYEDNVIDILVENLARWRRGEEALRNRVV